LAARSNNFQNPSIRWEKGFLPQICNNKCKWVAIKKLCCLTAEQTAQCFSLALYIAKKANFKKSKVLESSEFLKFSIAFLIRFLKKNLQILYLHLPYVAKNIEECLEYLFSLACSQI
jgi:hypothetical protein